MQATFVDVWNEVVDIRSEARHLSVALSRRGDKSPQDAQDIWERTHMQASAIEKIYTGCERVMSQLAANIDGAPLVHSDGWHVALLRRMANPFPNVREAIISSLCYARLDRLRAFRHRERNSYGIDLDPGIVFDRAREAVETFEGFESEIAQFMRDRGFDPAIESSRS